MLNILLPLLLTLFSPTTQEATVQVDGEVVAVQHGGQWSAGIGAPGAQGVVGGPRDECRSKFQMAIDGAVITMELVTRQLMYEKFPKTLRRHRQNCLDAIAEDWVPVVE